jgi:hypothetical protein
MSDQPLVLFGGGPEMWGFILTFLDTDDPRGAKEQFDQHYIGGWHSFQGFTFDKTTMELRYKGDPPYKMMSALFFRDEVIVLYPHSWVMVIQPDGDWEISRMN